MNKPYNSTGTYIRQPTRVTVKRDGEIVMQHVFQTSPVRVGRLHDNDFVLPFDFVSRHHCELHYKDDQWIAVDLGSKNGLVVDGKRVDEILLGQSGQFVIQDLIMHIEVEAMETATVHPDPTATLPFLHPQTIVADLSSSMAMPEVRAPFLDFDIQTALFSPHPGVRHASDLAIQVLTVWHDQILESREFKVGGDINWDWLGEERQLGQVRKGQTTIRVPNGCFVKNSAAGFSSAQQLVCSLDTPVAFHISESTYVLFRYVPKSADLPRPIALLPEDRFIDPLVLSAGVHGAMAVTAITIGYKPLSVKPVAEPERFAKIIVATPTPPPVVQATPTPTPVPIPTPEPPKVVEKPTPPPQIKVVQKKVKRPVAVAKKIEAAKLPPPPLKVAVVEPAPLDMAKAAPTPQPFNPKAMGALKALSILKTGASSKIANVEAIHISRSPSASSGSVIGAQAVRGTGEIISQLNESAVGGGKGDGTTGVALGGKGTGKYGVAGLQGKAGNRGVRGSVLGGATYTEISKNEGLSRDQVMKVVQKHHGQIQQCYERSLMDNPDLVGRAEFEWEITPKGDVTFVKVKEATVKDGERLLDCVKGVFGRMKFPIAKNGEHTTPTIGLPFGRL